MTEQNEESLRERIERLEKIVAGLQRKLEDLQAPPPRSAQTALMITPSSPAPTPGAPVHATAAPPRATAAPRKREISRIMTGEYWLNKIGIGLLLFGVAFLFKFSIDQGWLTPPVRVIFGLVIGIVLLVLGIRIHAKKRHFSQVLSGGGIAAFYITGFAAFQLYTLISYPFAMTFMVAVTLISFFLSVRQNAAALSVIGALGGLGTPFLLYTGSANLPGLMGYTCLVLAGTGAIHFYRGWRSLLWTSAIGGWAVFFVVYVKSLPFGPSKLAANCWALQLGLIFSWLMFWALPVVREVLALKYPDRWTRPFLDFLPGSVAEEFTSLADQHLHLLSVIAPIVTLIMSRPIWEISGKTWGFITLGGAIIYGFVSWYLKRWDVTRLLAYTHMIIALLLLNIAFCLIMRGDLLFFVLAAEATALHIISSRLPDRGLQIIAHALFGVLVIWLGYHLTIARAEGTPVFNSQALTDLFVILAGVGVSRLFALTEVRQAYRVIAHIAFLGWLLRELSPLTNGQAYVTLSWGIYAIALLIIGLRSNLSGIRITGMVTILVVVGKLFIVDLAMLKAIWRILLFLGFGAIFLFLSYYFQALWRGPSRGEDTSMD